MALNLDSIIERLVAVKTARPGTCVPITDKEAAALVAATEEVVSSQPVLLQLEAPIQIIGDIHGQYSDLLRMLDFCGLPGNGAKYLFLGDYVDRGPNGIVRAALAAAPRRRSTRPASHCLANTCTPLASTRLRVPTCGSVGRA